MSLPEFIVGVLFCKAHGHQKTQHSENAEMCDFIKAEKVAGIGHLFAGHQYE